MTADQIRALVERLQKYCATLAPPIARGLTHEAQRALTTLLAENQQLRKDADRYRWAIAKEDNAAVLYAAVLSCGPSMQEGINVEVDAARPQIDGSN